MMALLLFLYFADRLISIAHLMLDGTIILPFYRHIFKRLHGNKELKGAHGYFVAFKRTRISLYNGISCLLYRL